MLVTRPKLSARGIDSFDAEDLDTTTALAAMRNIGPPAQSQWRGSIQQLIQASLARTAGPAWWNDDVAFFAMIETRLAQTQYSWNGMKRPAEPRFAIFQFTLAGTGIFEQDDQPPRQMEPGTGFFVIVPSRHRYYLPKQSPGWTFGWVNIHHPYLVERIARQISVTDPIVHFEPNDAVFLSAMRLVSGSFRKDFVDIFAVELAVFEFVIAYERLAHRLSDPSCEGERMLESVRKLIHADPQRSLDVTTLASEYGMGRSHFTRVFRARTGQTPACVIAQARVEEASRMLRHGRASLRQIASACGFVSVNHFSRVFYRFQHINPGAYRKLIAISKR